MSKELRTRASLSALYDHVMKRLPRFPFILFYGTLLGYVREGDIIEGDDDIDVLLPFRERDRFLHTVKRNTFTITVDDPRMIQIFIPSMGYFDVYFYEDRNLDILIRWDGNLLFSKQDIWPLKPVLFKGHRVSIPFHSEKILQETYGIDWRTPLKKNAYQWESIHHVRTL